MSIYFKDAGEWKQVARPYVKRNGTWTPVQQVWRKESGAWVKYFEWDITPPPAPLLSLDLVPTSKGRYLNIGVSIPGGNNADVKMIRVLASKSAYPATQFGGTYYSTPDKDYPNEPWSDYYYGSGKEHSATNIWAYKQYPINYTSESNVEAGRYYFQAWALDFNGNWSAGTFLSITVPQSGLGSNVISRDGRFQALYSGTHVQDTGVVIGDMTQAISPVRQGMLFYGSQFINSIGSYYGDGNATITTAQIYIKRVDTDGPATANVYAFRHPYNLPDDVPAGGPSHSDTTKIGTISKGEGKWLPLPEDWYPALVSGTTRGIGFFYRDPFKAAAFAEDYSVLGGLTEDNRRAGELFIVWNEKASS